MSIKNIASAAAFDSEVLAASRLTACVFTADWCPWCRTLAPRLEAIAPRLPEVDIISLDVDQAAEVKERYGVRTIPTIILFRNGEELDQAMVSRHSEDDLLRFISAQLPAGS